MKTFKYRAINPETGQSIRDRVEAETLIAARTYIEETQNLIVAEIKEEKPLTQSFLSNTTYSHRNDKDIVIISKRLHFLLQNGISISDSLDCLSEEFEKKKKYKEAFLEIKEDLRNGSSLSQGFSNYPKLFPPIFVKMVEIGEISGSLEDILGKLSVFFDRSQKLKEKIKRSLTSPMFTLVVAFAVIIFMVTYILPQLLVMFEAFNSELPAITKSLMNLTYFVADHVILIIIIAVCTIFLVKQLYGIYEVKRVIHGYLLKIPIIGTYICKYQLSLFCRTFGLMLSSGIEILGSLEICSQILSNVIIQEGIDYIRKEVENGVPLSIAAKEYKYNNWQFPALFTTCINIGERTGAIDNIISELAEDYQYDIDASSDQILLFVNGLVIIVLGIVVGYIALGMYLPIISMTDGLTI